MGRCVTAQRPSVLANTVSMQMLLTGFHKDFHGGSDLRDLTRRRGVSNDKRMWLILVLAGGH